MKLDCARSNRKKASDFVWAVAQADRFKNLRLPWSQLEVSTQLGNAVLNGATREWLSA
jgi:hypothetical protein